MKASLFITCLVDLFYPEIGLAMVNVLKGLGISLHFPAKQTCCGQPAFNNGYIAESKRLALRFISVFENSDWIVTPSGSCAYMVKHHYPLLFRDDPQTLKRVWSISAKLYEFSDFLVNVCQATDLGAKYNRTITYHDSCHLRNGLGIMHEPRRLIQGIEGARFLEMKNSDQCCGFGGTFYMKFPEISRAIVNEKVGNIIASGAEIVTGNDTGCLMNIGMALRKKRSSIRVMHLAELLNSRR